MPQPRIVLAYAGGLEATVAIPWLAEQHAAEVVTVTLDLGQGAELADVRQRALDSGAVRAHVLDVKEEFARDYALRALRAGALREGGRLFATALGRPLLATYLVAIADMEQASAVAHGCRTEGDQRCLERAVRDRGPEFSIIAPVRTWAWTRNEVLAVARERGLPVPPGVSGDCRVDANVWGRSIECGMLQDPWVRPPEEVYTLTRPRTTCPDTPASVEIEFVEGMPVGVNGVTMGLVELMASLDTIAGAHGVGRIDLARPGGAGRPCREIAEAPAAAVLHLAHREVESLTVPWDLAQVASGLGRAYADLIEDGRWFTPTRDAIDAFVDRVQQRVTGVARLELFKGSCVVTGRASQPSGSA